MAATDDSQDEPDWEAIARRHLAREAEERSRDLDIYVNELCTALTDREADAEDIREFRRHVDLLLYVVEDDIASIVDGTDPYDSEAYLKDTAQALDLLDLTAAQATEAGDGATVELTTEEIRALCNGSGVQLETSGGIDVELLPAQPAEVNPGP